MVKISRHCGCQWQVCNGYWEQDLGQEIRLCRINEEEHPMEDQWAKFGLFVISVRKLAQVLVFCGSSIVSDFGSDHVFQLLALTAGLVSQLNFDTCSCLLPSFFGTSLGHGLSPPAPSLLLAHLCFQGNVLFRVFSWLQTYWGNAHQRQILGWIWKYRSWKHQQILQLLLLSLIAAQLAGLSCLLFSFLLRTAITGLFIESAALGHWIWLSLAFFFPPKILN